MKIKKSIVVSISGIGVGIIGFIMPVYIEIIKPYAVYILFLGFCLLLCPWLLLLYDFLKNKRREPTALTATIVTNNPDFFPSLNESALKKHISFYAKGLPYNDVIDNIQLHKSTSKKYQIIVKGKDTSRFESLKSAWNANIGDLLNEDFKEVYRSNPSGILEDEWGYLVVDPNTSMQPYFLSKEKWHLLKIKGD